MSGTAIRRIGGLDPTANARITYLENNTYKITYFEAVNSSSGTVTKPTNSIIQLNQLAGGVDAYVSTIQNGQPTGDFPQTVGGTIVDVASFDALGNYTLTGTPSAFPVAIIYVLTIKAVNYQNLDETKVLDPEDINAVPYSGATQNVDLGNKTLTAGSIIKTGGLSTQFLKADGSVDSISYTPQIRTITATGNGIIGGGDLSANRTFSLDFTYLDGRYAASGSGVTSFNTRTGAITLLSLDVTGALGYTPQPTGNYITALTGDGSASGPGSAILTLATVNANIGTFNNVTVNAKGLVTAASNVAYLTGNQTITLSGEATGSGTTGIAVTLSNVAVIGKVLTGYVSGAGVVSATDSILQAIQKLNGNVSALVTGVSSVSGTTNRITASPTTGAVVVDISSTFEALLGKVASPLSQFASTTSAQLAGVMSDETGTGSLVFANSPTLITPNLGTPSTLVLTNATGLPLSTGITGTLPIANGGRNNTAAVTNGVDYYDGTKFTTSGSFLFDGTQMGIGVVPQSLLTVSRQSTIQAPVSGSTAHFVGLDANPLRLTFDTHNNASASGTALMGRRSRGTSTAPLATTTDDVLFSINGRGYGTTGYAASSTGLITINQAQAATDANMGTYISISTTPNNSVTAAEALRITGAGAINAFQAGGVFQVNGTTVLSSSTLGSGVTASSLTSVGTISTGVWNGTIIGTQYGGTGVNNATNISGSFLRSNGTNGNYAASTLTIPNTSTNGRVVYSTGTNQWGENAGLTYDGTTFNANQVITVNTAGSIVGSANIRTTSATASSNNGYSSINTSTSGSSGIAFGNTTSLYSTLLRYGSTATNTLTANASIALLSSTMLQSGNTGTEQLVFLGSPFIFCTGVTAGNIGMRLSSVGLRIGLNSNLHTNATSGLTLDDAFDINFGSTAGTKVGGTGSKLAMYGAAPLARQAAITPAAGGIVVDIQARAVQNLIITAIQNFGITL